MENVHEDIGEFPHYRDEFATESFAPSIDLPPTDSDDGSVNNFPTCARVESSLSPWQILPTIDLNLILSCFMRQRSSNLIRNLLSSTYLEKQQKSVLEKTVIFHSSRNPQPKYSVIFIQHLLTLLIVLASLFLNFYLFVILCLLTVSIFIFQIKVFRVFSVILMYSTFPKVLQDIARLEEIFKEFSKALKLLKQIQIVEKTCFKKGTQPFHYNDTHLTYLKQLMTGLYFEVFTSLQTKSDFFSMKSLAFRRDEMICTLKPEDILYQIYKEPHDNIQDLGIANMSLDSFKMWHCLVTCQYSEYIEILVRILGQNFLFPNSPLWQLHLMRSIDCNRILEYSKYEDGHLSQLVYLTRSDVYCSDLNMNNFRTPDLSTEGENKIDHIDLILQCCIVKLRNLKEIDNTEKEDEMQFLKLNLENALEGLKNIGKSISVETNIPTTFSKEQGENRINTPEDELILPKSDTLQVPECMEVVFEGVSLDKHDLGKDLFDERESQTYFDSAATKTVLRELKCVLATKKVNNCESKMPISQQETMDYNFQPHLGEDVAMNSTVSSSNTILENTGSMLPHGADRLDENPAHNLLNLVILTSGRNKQLEQTVIGDEDSD